MNGKGLLTWSDGKKYDGEHLNDMKHGFGTYEWGDGRKYTGNWKLGK